MYQDRQDLTALIGSRICHDLISPLGAISNGLELLVMSGLAQTPEMDLIAQSIENANSKIRFFRVAYGKAAPGATLARGEIAAILDDYFRGARLSVVWHPMHELQRRDVKLAFLAIQCLETSLPYGGDIDIVIENGRWTLSGRGDKLGTNLAHWALVEGKDMDQDLGAANVHFGMLASLTEWRKPAVTVEISEKAVIVRL